VTLTAINIVVEKREPFQPPVRLIGYLQIMDMQSRSNGSGRKGALDIPAGRPGNAHACQHCHCAPGAGIRTIPPRHNGCRQDLPFQLGNTMSDLKQRFEDAVQYVQSATGDFKPSNEMKLEFYSLFKQATEGDVKGKKPGLTDFIGRAKYSAWENLKGMSSEKAMETYIAKIEALKKKHG
jgi:diazepam-binding inhibitor (GABA receptor modulator, acyl-CoA-binding protein)